MTTAKANAILLALASAADPNVNGACVLAAGAAELPGWFVVLRAGGRVRLDTADGSAPLAAAVAAVLGADLSDDAQAARELAANPDRAALLSRVDRAIADLAAYRAIPNPSAAQRLAFERGVCDVLAAVLRRLIQL